MSEEICGDDILLDAIAFSETRHFEDAVDAFKERNHSLFMKHASNQGDGNDCEHVRDSSIVQANYCPKNSFFHQINSLLICLHYSES